jgi:hypothetical protein
LTIIFVANTPLDKAYVLIVAINCAVIISNSQGLLVDQQCEEINELKKDVKKLFEINKI